jgi:O-antigen ligase
MAEPALCDILFPPVFLLTLVTGHLLSPLRLPHMFTGSIIVFMLANLASVLGARLWGYGDAMVYMTVTLYLLVYSAFFALFVGRFGPVGMTIVRDGYQIGAVIASGIGILASLHLLPNSEIFFRDASLQRIQSTFEDPNVFAPFLVGAVFLSLAPFIHEERLQIRHGIVIALSLTGITLAFSRGAYVHLIVSLVVFVALELVVVRDLRAARRLVVGITVITPLLAIAVGALLVNTGLASYMQERLSMQSYDQVRFSNQFESLLVAHENLLGVGPGQYAQPRFLQDPHNNYLKVLAENGAVGLLSFLALVFTCVFYGLAGVFRRGRLAPVQAACVAVLAGIIVESLVIDTLHWRHYFLFLGLPVGLTLYERAQEATSRLDSAPCTQRVLRPSIERGPDSGASTA